MHNNPTHVFSVEWISNLQITTSSKTTNFSDSLCPLFPYMIYNLYCKRYIYSKVITYFCPYFHHFLSFIILCHILEWLSKLNHIWIVSATSGKLNAHWKRNQHNGQAVKKSLFSLIARKILSHLENYMKTIEWLKFRSLKPT